MEVELSMIHEICEDIKKRISRKYMAECGLKNEFPRELWKVMVDTGLVQLGIAEEYGGVGGGLTAQCYALDNLAQAGIRAVFMIPNNLAREAIMKHGNTEQQDKYIRPAATGEAIYCFAITEPNAGTNTFKIESMARRQPNGDYLLSGQKVFITNFDVANHCLVVARTTPFNEVKDRREGISLFIIDTKSKGIDAHQMNIGADMPDKQYHLFFDDVLIPKENLIGEEGKGLQCLFGGLNPERLLSAASSVGMGDYVLNKGVEYAKQRAPFDQPIGAYQAIQHPMAYAKVHLEAARLMMYKACEDYDKGKKVAVQANMAKLLASEAAYEACKITMEAHGGYAFDRETDLLGFFLQSNITLSAPVNNKMIVSFIGEHVLGLPKSYY